MVTDHEMRMEALRLSEENERLRDILQATDHTLAVHGHIDRATPLHNRIASALARMALHSKETNDFIDEFERLERDTAEPSQRSASPAISPLPLGGGDLSVTTDCGEADTPGSVVTSQERKTET